MPFKVCFVPKCLNTSENSNKLFISVPINPITRAKWFSAINVPVVGRKDICCCEDHFDMERDAKNWIHYKLMGSRLVMRDDVFPHKYLKKCKSPTTESSQLSPSARKRKMEMSKRHAEKVKKLLSDKISEAPSAQDIQLENIRLSSRSKEAESPGELMTIPLECEVQSTASHVVSVSKENKKVQVNIKPSMRSVSTNTNKILTRSVPTNTIPDNNKRNI